MTKRDISATMRNFCGAEFISISDIARYCGKSRDWVRDNLTHDLAYLSSDAEKSKRYYIGDVAERIMAVRRC